MIIYESAME